MELGHLSTVGMVRVKVYMIKMMGPMVMLILVTFSGDADIDIDY